MPEFLIKIVNLRINAKYSNVGDSDANEKLKCTG